MSKIFRVFFSSTFSDFVEERNALQKNVFSNLKELCAAYGTRFQPVDLRWGIPDEVALQQSTMQICLGEIKRCQNLTPRPNFLVLLGERYGWTPPPAKIPKNEYDVISAHFSEKDKILLKEWYRLDENELCKLDNGTITSVYELQPREEEYENYEEWEPTEINLRDTLLQAAQRAELSEKEIVKYYASATHQEIVGGALEAHEVDSHVHCFFRKLTRPPNNAESNVFTESDPEKAKYLSDLKLKLRQQLPLNIHEYEVDFGDEKDKENYLKKFCNDVFLSLKTTILQELEDMEEFSALDEEINVHIEFAKARTKVFVGRESILDDIMDYVESDNRAPFVIFGKPGSGKSALMAKSLERLEKQKKENTDYILRFIGTTPSSSTSIALLRNICEQIINKYEIDFEEEIPYEYIKLQETFINLLSLIQEGRCAVILVDALDQLPKRDEARDLTWLPEELPITVKLITSIATDDIDLLNSLKKKLPNSLHELKRLSRGEGKIALNFLLKDSLRRLNSDQETLLLQKFSENGLPLYLKLAFEEACTWNSYSKIRFIKLASDIEGLIEILLERLYSAHTRKTVERILSYIVAARNGLTEDEILDVLTSDLDYFEWYKKEQSKYHKLPEPRLPWIVWSRLHFDLEPYLTKRGVDHTSTIVFFHRQFNDAIQRKFLSKIADDRHQVLAHYYNNVDLYYQKNGSKIPNFRKLSELVYNLRKAKMWKTLEKNLTDLEFIEAKCTALMIEDLLIDYNRSLDDWPSKDMPDEIGKNINEFKQFVFNQAHILRKYPNLTIQQALNQPDSTLPSEAGKDFIKIHDFSRLWIEWVNKPQERDPCITTFTGHSLEVEGCTFSPDGAKVVSASRDTTLKLWEAETGAVIRTFTGHSETVYGCAFSPDGTKVVSASSDKTLKLWEVETGAVIRTFTGHSKGVYGCAFSPDGTKVVSASGDYTLKLWDVETGAVIRTFTGHSAGVYGCAFSPDGTKVVSALGDTTLKLWEVETGTEIRTFTGHSKGVYGCAFSPDGTKVVSASGDKTLKLWDVETGTVLRTFTGHSNWVEECAFSPDGAKVVSASRDTTLKLWEVETGAVLNTFTGHSESVEGCAFSPEGAKVVSASGDTTLKLWEVETRTEIRTFTGHSKSVWGCAFSPDGAKVVSASWDTTLKLWEAETRAVIRTFTGHSSGVVGCAFSPDGTKVVSASLDKTLKLWEVETGTEIRTFTGHSAMVMGCNFSPDGTKVVSASLDRTLKLWEVETGAVIRTFTGHTEVVNECAFSPDGAKVVSASGDTTLKLWDVETGAAIRTFTGHSNWVYICSFSPDGTKVVSASLDKTLKLWDAETGAVLRTFTGHTGRVNGCAFSPDGTKVVSVSRDKTLMLWDAETGTVSFTFPSLRDILSVAVGVNGLITAGDAGGWIYFLRPHGIDLTSTPQQ